MPGNREEKCYFCGENTIRFHEHYHFCPDCSAIYTYLIVLKSRCEHIKERTPTVIRQPWYKEVREGKAYIEDLDKWQKCSICGRACTADGW